MIVREVKLKLTPAQESRLNDWLWNLTGVYNWAIRKIELNAQDKIYFSRFDFQNLLVGHHDKLGIPSHVLQAILAQAYLAWKRCFKKIARKPRLKGARNKLNSIPFPDPIKAPKQGRFGLPGLGKVRFFKQELPEGKIKRGRIIKRASGWYLQLTIGAEHKFSVAPTEEAIGIDTGFKDLLVLSNGRKYENTRELRAGAKRLAQAQRGQRKRLAARLHERQANRRKDRNHKISREIVETYAEIYITKDSLKGQAKLFGKSIAEASIGGLLQNLLYKGRTAGRVVEFVDSKDTTKTCSACGCLSGPSGLSELAVRQWQCQECGAQHDRDKNAARNVLTAGAGCALGFLESSGGAR